MKLFFSFAKKTIALILIVGIIVRIVLAATTPGSLDMSIGQWVNTFCTGLINDLCVGIISLVFMWLYILSIGEWKFRKVPGGIILGALALVEIYVCCFNTVFDEYGSVVPRIAQGVFGFWLVSFALRYFLPQIRRGWTRFWFWAIAGVYVFIIYFNAAGEYFFWEEFNVRYNFIAVDYLIYTNEVVGNIMESYAMVPLTIVAVIISAVTTWLLYRSDARSLPSQESGTQKLTASVIYLIAAVVSGVILSVNGNLQSSNTYHNELRANGVYKFFDAFRKNHLDYQQFYYFVEPAEAEAFIHRKYGSTGKNERHIEADSTAVVASSARPNIVLITIESLSASFMERYGDDRHLTPNLDSLAVNSLTFNQVFATGNRTVRGLEALSLSLPPCPGESIVKRPDCSGLRTTGVMLSEMGYKPMYFYGGNSYFDNMGTFFGGNGYEVIDVKSYKPEEITFQNIWGVADEDSYNKLLSTLDGMDRRQPFFAHLMTISNHRPFTYPEGRISIPTDSKTRAGGVMYTDYALGQFFEKARQKDWFANTVFVVIADHCASSAGKTELPLEKYHIPAMIYAPGMIQPQTVDAVCSQIDIMPTLFALLGFSYDSAFFGENVLSPDYKERAFLATYENLGYLENDTLTVLSPVRRIEQFRRVPTAENPFNTEPVEQPGADHARRAAAYYQTSAKWYEPNH